MLGWRVIPRIGFGDFAISPHGVGIAIGVFVGALVMARRARARGFDENHVWNGAAVGVIGAIIGARVAYVVGHFDQFASPAEWLQIWRGGISLVGGLLGAFAAVLIYTRRQKISFFELVDLGAPGLGIGIAVGRFGDLMIGDHLGRETSFFLGWQYQGGELISPPPCLTPAGEPVYSTVNGCIEPGIVVHQTALYDMIWSLAIFGIVMFLARKPRGVGFLFLSWASLYAVGRIATDFLRVDKTWFGLGLTGSQLTSIAALAICAFFLIRYRGVPQAATEKEEWLETAPDSDLSDLAPVSAPAQAVAATDEELAGEPFNPAAPPPPPKPETEMAPEPPPRPESPAAEPEPAVEESEADIDAELFAPEENPDPIELLSLGHQAQDSAHDDTEEEKEEDQPT